MKKYVEGVFVICVLVIIAVCFSIPTIIYATDSNAVPTPQLLWTEVYINDCRPQQVIIRTDIPNDSCRPSGLRAYVHAL